MLSTRVCIAGGGPAGMMLGLLLARAGIDAIVLEKHADFLRDFRGDTVHPSTMVVMAELGLLEHFLSRPHDRADQLGVMIGETLYQVADFRALPVPAPFIAMMPQWHFLDFLAEAARAYPCHRLMMNAEAVGLRRDGEAVTGVDVNTPDGVVSIAAEIVIAADGRGSTLRARSGLPVEDLGAPMDVLWMRLSRRADDPGATIGRLDAGRFLITIDRGAYWQCAFVIPKGAIETVRARGLTAFHTDITRLAPHFADRVAELATWDDIKLLTVTVNRLTRWYRAGLLCIGDAAHAMSPVGGVGVNLAVQDAVAAANVLVPALRAGGVGEAAFRAIEKRRRFPTRLTQRAQVVIQNRLIKAVLTATERPTAPWPLRMLNRFAWLRRFPARAIGMGVRPEHIRH